MANNQGEGFGDDLFEQIVLQVPGYNSTTTTTGGGLEPAGFLGVCGGSNEAPSSSSSSMMLGLGGSTTSTTGDRSSGHHHHHRHGLNVGLGVGVGGGFRGLSLPLGLNLDHSVAAAGNRFGDGGGDGAMNVSSSSSPRINDGDTVNFTNLFPAFGHIQPHFLRPVPPPASIQLHPQPSFQGHAAAAAAPPQPSRAAPHPPGIRPRVRARRGQATDPHSIAERLRRERIAERMKALQELVPSCNKTDRAAMLDEIVDYVKFLRLQVKVLSMSRLGGAGAVAQLVADVPTTSIEGQGGGLEEQPAWEKWSNDGTEQQVARLMDQDIGAAMQLLQSKSLCIMPISLASAIFPAHPPPVSDSTTSTIIKPESGGHP